jgi:hypothetical protein
MVAPTLSSVSSGIPPPARPEIGDWNKPLLELFQKSQGKKSYEEFRKNPDMIKYADDIADYLIKTNPNVVQDVKKAISNPSSKLTLEPDGYRKYLPYLNKVVEQDKRAFPYYHVPKSQKSGFKKMFYDRFKAKIYNLDELQMVEQQELAQTPRKGIPEDDELDIPMGGISTTLSSHPPTISSIIPPPPPPLPSSSSMHTDTRRSATADSLPPQPVSPETGLLHFLRGMNWERHAVGLCKYIVSEYHDSVIMLYGGA